MASLSALKASVADLTARVKNATSVEASVTALVQAMVQQNKDLAARVDGMDAGDISQDDLDAISKELSESATALDEGTAALAKAAAYDPNANRGGAGAGKYPGNVSGAGNQGGIQGQPGVGSAAIPDPALGGQKGGPGQFIDNPPGPAGSDNPDQPRRDQLGDATPGTYQPNPQNPVPLSAKPKPLAGTDAAPDNAAAAAAAAAGLPLPGSAPDGSAPSADQSAPKPAA